jgi:hypothetical protein
MTERDKFALSQLPVAAEFSLVDQSQPLPTPSLDLGLAGLPSS